MFPRFSPSLCLLFAFAALDGTSALAQNATITAPTFTAQTVSSGTLTITASGAITTGGTTRAVTMSGSGTAIDNSGTIEQTGTERAVQANGTNLTITNQVGGNILTNSQDAIRAGNSNAATSITLNNSGVINARNVDPLGANTGQAVDWNSIATGANTINNSGSLLANGADAVRPGVNGRVNNPAGGIIRATPVVDATGNFTGSDGIDAQDNATGVVVVNTGTISGRHGITGGNTTFSISVTNNAGGLIQGVNGSGINIDGLFTTSTATVLNNGTITGSFASASANGDGDGVDVDGVLNLTNNGIIRGLGAKGVDSGGLPNGSDGVAAGGGTIINNAGAEISGRQNGGANVDSHGILVDNGSGGSAVAAATITNSGLIRGYEGFAIGLVGNFNDTVTNNAGGTIQGGGTAASGAAIQTGGGDDTVTNRGTIIGGNGRAVDLGAGNDTLIVEGASAVITGSIDGGAGNNTLTINPGAGNNFSFGSPALNLSTIQVTSGTFTLTSGGSIAPGVNGAGTTAVQGSLTLNDGARFAMDLNLNTGSDKLTVSGTLALVGGGRIFFDLSDAGGLGVGTYDLVDAGTLAGLTDANLAFGQVPAGFVGTLNVVGNSIILTVNAVPEPSTWAMLGVGAVGAGLVALRRRQTAS